ncbi:MAG: sigma-70 family RNA polymerase sigma factor [Solirubrobacteraceae bacterium]
MPANQQVSGEPQGPRGGDGVRTGSKASSERTSSGDGDDEPGPSSRVPRGDEADLFRAFNPHFVRIVQRRTNTSPDIVDDACAFAWQQFMRYQPDRDRNWRAWLVTTAEREAWRLHGVEANHVGFLITDDEGRQGPIHEPADPHDPLAIRMRLREALQALGRVPDRRRQVKALHVTGFSYDEIGERLDLSYTRVNRLITEANAVIREEQGRSAAVNPDQSARAARLDELERTSPRWLVGAIGRRPAATAEPAALLAWRRAALAIDDYRRRHGQQLGDAPLGDRPPDRDAARAFDLATAAIRRACDAKSKDRSLGLER